MDLSWKYQMNPIEGTLKLEVLKRKEAKELDIYPEHINIITLTFPLPCCTSSICIAFCRSRVALATAAAMTASTSAVRTWHFFNEESRKDGVAQNREQSENEGEKFSTSQLMSVLFNATEDAPRLKVGILRKKHFHFFFSCAELGNAATAVALLSLFSHLNRTWMKTDIARFKSFLSSKR